MAVSYSDAKKMIDEGLKSSVTDPLQMQEFIVKTLKLKGSATNLFNEALESHPQLLDKLKPEQLEKLSKFISKNAIKYSPLYDKYSPNQKQKLGLASADSLLAKLLVEAEMIKRKDGSSSPRGLWDNIRDKKERGEKPREKGSDGAPTKEAFKKSQADYGKNYGFMDGIEELEERFADLKAINPSWSDSDTLSFMKNRSARYTHEWEWIEEREEELKRHGKITIAAPKKTDEAGKPVLDTKKNKKEVLKEFSKPEMDEAKFYIGETRAYGGGWWDLSMSLPVSVEFLKAKAMDFKMGDFGSFNSSDPIEILTMMANQELMKRTGQRFSRPSISTVDLSRQRAKNGMKTVSMTWQVNSPFQAYALGCNLDHFGGSFPLVKSPSEYDARLEEAQKVQEEAQVMKQELKDGKKTQEEYNKFILDARDKGMNRHIYGLKTQASLPPTLAKVLGGSLLARIIGK